MVRFMERYDDLKKVFSQVDENIKVLVDPLIDDVAFLEKRLSELRQYPFISVNPNNSSQQRTTPAGKQYKELLQQYSNCIKVLASVLNKNSAEEESPLRSYIKSLETRGGQ